MLRTVCLLLAIGAMAAAAGLVPLLFASDIGTGPALQTSVVTTPHGHRSHPPPGCRHRMASQRELRAPTGSPSCRCRHVVRDCHPRR